MSANVQVLNHKNTFTAHGGGGGSSTKSHRPQAEKEGGWVMAIFEKKSIYLKIIQGFSGSFSALP